nr:hypothetical protein Iba_chr08eCG6460 [Ipomoea batatas]
MVAVGVTMPLRRRQHSNGELVMAFFSPIATRRSRVGGTGQRSFLFRLPIPLGSSGVPWRLSPFRSASSGGGGSVTLFPMTEVGWLLVRL